MAASLACLTRQSKFFCEEIPHGAMASCAHALLDRFNIAKQWTVERTVGVRNFLYEQKNELSHVSLIHSVF